MKYQEAVELLIQGKYVTRPVWKVQNSYLVYLPGITHLLRVNTQSKPEVTPWAANVEDSKAEDWAEIDPSVEEKVPEADPA